MIRAFVAIRPPEEACEALEELQADLPAGRTVAFENIHLTLSFLGEHPASDYEDLSAELGRIRAAPFALTLSGVGVFGDARPRSVHVGVAPSAELAALRRRIARVAEVAGMGERRKFHAHVTLARFNGDEGAGLSGWLAANAGFRLDPFDVAEFLLMRSDLTRAGPVYTEMARYPL